jgi:hypothetical protein
MNAGEFVVIGVSWRHVADSKVSVEREFSSEQPTGFP